MPQSGDAAPLPVLGAPLVVPTSASCLRCQLTGRRRTLCSLGSVCKSVPHVFILGPLLVLGWLATVTAFLVAIK